MQKDIAAVPSKLWREAQHTRVHTSWQILLNETVCTHAQRAALFVAERMRNPDFVHATVDQVTQKSMYPLDWFSGSLSAGDVSLAFMYGYIDMCFQKQGWDTLTQRYFNLAAAGTQQSGFMNPSMYNGTSGMALALSQAGRGGTRYQKTLARLNQGLCEQVFQQTWLLSAMDQGVAAHDYDVISGAAGVLAYLISIEQPDEQVRNAIEYVLAYLLWLAEPGQPPGKERWYIPPALLPTERHRQESPQGNFNCGLAHGIPGPLSALALTWLAGYRYPGLRESIDYLAQWIKEHHVIAPWGIDWSASIPLEAASNPRDWKNVPATRSAWCYGAPGVARSLWLAGQALDDTPLLQFAVEAIEIVLLRAPTARRLFSPHICHGVAGLLQICLRFAQEAESSLIKSQIPILVEQLLNAFNPDTALGFCDMDEGQPLDQPGWLIGAPGIAMALLAASTPVVPAWDRALIIA